MNSVTVATFHERDNAEPLKKRLEEAGLTVSIRDERRMQRLWFMSDPLAGVKIEVEESQENNAKELLNKWHKEKHVLQDAIFCPDCGSPEVEYPQMTRKFLAPSLMEILFALKFLKREFYCRHCHYSWPKEEILDVERDPLGWPKKHHTETVTTTKKTQSSEPGQKTHS